jgi:hypothetical protein
MTQAPTHALLPPLLLQMKVPLPLPLPLLFALRSPQEKQQ